MNIEIPSTTGGKVYGVVLYPEKDPVKSTKTFGSPTLMIDPLRFYYNDPKLPKSEIAITDSSPLQARYIVLHEFGHLLGLKHEMGNKNFPIDFRETNNQFVAGQSHTASEDYHYHGEFDPYSVMGYHIKGLSPLPFLSLQDKLWIAKTYPGRMTEEEIRKEHEKDIKKFSNNGHCKIYEPNSIDSKNFSCKEKFGIGSTKENWIHKIGCYETIEMAISAMARFSKADSNCGPFYDEAPENFEAENKALNASPDCPLEGTQNSTVNDLTSDVAKIVHQIPKPETH